MKKQTLISTAIVVTLILSIAPLYIAPARALVSPDIEIWKRFMDTSDPPPYELRTFYHWDIEIGVSTNVDLTHARVSDRFGAELKIDSITIPGKTYTFTYPDYEDKYPTNEAEVTISGVGTYDLDRRGVTFGAEPYKFHIYWSGSSHKVHFEEWSIGNLKAGETITIIVRVSTDLNPGGKQEFTSPCEHCINSGAVLKAMWKGRRISRGTEQLCIKVACAAELILDKFNDLNGNGEYDAGDVKIPDWRIHVTDPYGVTTTYLTPKTLEITEFGTYIIEEDLPIGWEQTAVRVDGLYKIPPTLEVKVLINIGETHDVLYGNRAPPPPGKLILDKFNDLNGNGEYDAGDVKIPDWRIHVTDPYGVTTTYLTPKTLEITEFGTYIIEEDLPVDWVQTAVRVDGSYIVPPTLEVKVTVDPGETHDVLYGNWIPPPPPGKLIVEKFNDLNGNGEFDGGDVMITDWEIYVTDPDGVTTTYHTPLDLEITLFGTYTITEDLPTLWVQTAVRVDGVYRDPPTRTVTVDINAGESHDVLYGNWIPPGKLVVEKFNDLNGNGEFDGGDVMITDWEIDVTDPDGVTVTYTTPVNLDITNFGTYTITEDLPARWEQTAVRVDGSYVVPPTLEVKVTIDPGETHDVLYGNKEKPPPPPATISLIVNPALPSYVTPGGTVSFSWTITFLTTPKLVTLEVKDPTGTMVVYSNSWNVEGATSPITGSDSWAVPLGATLGYYTVKVSYYSAEIGPTVPEATASRVFRVAS